MAKKIVANTKTAEKKPSTQLAVRNVQNLQMIANELSLFRRNFMQRYLDGKRDLDGECGYPTTVTIDHCRLMYDRDAIASRIISLFPEESWLVDPEVSEKEEQEETEWEACLKALNKQYNLWHYCQRVDEQCGVGRYGLLLIGLDDGQSLDQPIKGINERGEITVKDKGDRQLTSNALPAKSSKPPTATGKPVPGKPAPTDPEAAKEDATDEEVTPQLDGKAILEEQETHVIFLRVFDETLCQIDEYETDVSNPRFCQPLSYQINMFDPRVPMQGASKPEVNTQRVHWSRVLHVADNLRNSEIFGTPRLQTVYNRVYDLRKILSGSGEMFWKGAFPGLSFELDPRVMELGFDIDADALKQQMEQYQDGLQRFIQTVGLKVNSLAPQVASPVDHITVQIQAICIALGCPTRIFMGSERGELASSQDSQAWKGRIKRRQDKILTPRVVRPLIDRLMAAGVLPYVEDYNVDWPDIETPDDKTKADVSLVLTQAIAQYVSAGADVLMAPLEYLTTILHIPLEEAEAIVAASQQIADEQQALEEQQMQMQHDQTMALADQQHGQKLEQIKTDAKAKAQFGPKPKPAAKGKKK